MQQRLLIEMNVPELGLRTGTKDEITVASSKYITFLIRLKNKKENLNMYICVCNRNDFLF